MDAVIPGVRVISVENRPATTTINSNMILTETRYRKKRLSAVSSLPAFITNSPPKIIRVVGMIPISIIVVMSMGQVLLSAGANSTSAAMNHY